MNDYSEYCPGDNAAEFGVVAKALVETVKEMKSPSSNLEQVHAKKINRELSRIRNALATLPDETNSVIKDREIDANFDLGKVEGWANIEAFNSIDNAKIVWGTESSLDQLRAYVSDEFVGRKVDKRRASITIAAGPLWRKHGGEITATENASGFVSFLDRLTEDAELSFNPIRLIKEYLR